MNPFYSKLSEKISDLILAVIALGLLVVSVEYVQFLTDYPGTLHNPEFWKRIALTSLVIIFTAYKFIAYSAYFCAPDNASTLASLGPWRIILMFLCDLAQVTLVAWLYAILLIGHLTSAGDNSSTNEVTLGANVMLYLFGFMALWHLAVFIWYALARGQRYNKTIHGGFVLVYAIAVMILLLIEPSNDRAIMDWSAIGFYALCVLLLYRLKAVPDINKAIQSG